GSVGAAQTDPRRCRMLRFAQSISFVVACASVACAPAAAPTFTGDDRVFLLAVDATVHTIGADGTELTHFAAPAGTVSIVHDGAHLLALSPSGVDALDDGTGAVASHVSDVTGQHVALAAGRVAVADGGTTVTLVDDGTTLTTSDPVGELVSYDGALGYWSADAANTAWFHT